MRKIQIGIIAAAYLLFGGGAVASAYTEHHNPLSIVERFQAPTYHSDETVYYVDKIYDEANGVTCYAAMAKYGSATMSISCVK